VRRIRDRLRAVYGIPLMKPHGHPIAELVLTVLSQSTNDRNRDVAYLRLRERFPTWEAVRDAPVGKVEEAIRPGGISKVKSARIQVILRAISSADPLWPTQPSGTQSSGLTQPSGTQPSPTQPSGTQSSGLTQPCGLCAPRAPDRSPHELSLDWLPRVRIDEARDYLTALPGVGRKTAACVLLFAYGLRDVPVDTHVSRVGTRLGLLRAGAPFAELHDQMLALTPPGQELELHVNLLRHGRRTCHARFPACDECALARMCPSRQST
jgi:endonuclease-3